MKRTALSIILRAVRLVKGKKAKTIPFKPTVRTVMPDRPYSYNEWGEQIKCGSRYKEVSKY